MKISKIIFALATVSIFTITSCRDTKSKTETIEEHEHDEKGNHLHDETIEQEEFQVEKDSMEIKTETHKHDDGSENHDH